MKSFLISGNKDTWVGMKFAGIDGVIAMAAKKSSRL
jgi:hypothetical protein